MVMNFFSSCKRKKKNSAWWEMKDVYSFSLFLFLHSVLRAASSDSW